MDNIERQANFAHVAVHRTAEVAKALIRAHYGKSSRLDYFMGCSNGGRQALTEAQRYPDDFDGIVSGAPALNFTGVGAHFVQIQQHLYPNPNDLTKPVVTPENRKLLQSEILDRCDALDGVEDGVLNDPRQCDFDLDAIPRCRRNRPTADCLTKAQRRAVKVIYDGAVGPSSRIMRGFPLGGEGVRDGWDVWLTGGPDARLYDGTPITALGIPNLAYAFGTQIMKYLVFNDPDWDYASYDFAHFEHDTRLAAATLNSVDPDLSEYKARGGKLILWHGWSDNALTAYGSIDYFESVKAVDADVRDYFRLFMLPGVLHCSGGPGPSGVDYLTAIDWWVEDAVAPRRLEAFFLDAERNPAGSRPICAYPLRAVYNGSGDTRDASSFECRADLETNKK